MPALVVDRVSHRYGALNVLEAVTLRVELGETIAVEGPSGSGKTTLLAIAGGLLQPSAGCAYVGDDGAALPPRGWCSWVLQTTSALGRRTSLDNAALGALALGADVTSAHRLAREALDAVGLLPRMGTEARHLSGGELQRLCIARALASGQPFLIADEPTGQLDQRTAHDVADALFGALEHRACGMLVATHDPMIARRCQRVVRIVDGRLVTVSR
jgi:predicted ABC-type transport system involved in lysophospholipase L1 biosynthesis ATPase subunit